MSTVNGGNKNHELDEAAEKKRSDKEYRDNWREKNRDKYNENHRKYYAENKEKHINEVMKSRKKRGEGYNEYLREYMREYRKRKKAEQKNGK